MKNIVSKASLLLSILFVSILLSGCNDEDNHRVITTSSPTVGQRAVITTENIDSILATSVSGVDKIASLVDGLVEQLPTVRTRSRGLSDLDITTRECAEGGDISVDKVTTSGATLSFTQCQEQGYLLNGTVVIDSDGTRYDATFDNFTAIDSQNSVTLIAATAHIVGDDYTFFIADGSVIAEGNAIAVQNFKLEKIGQEATVNGSLLSACVGAWIDVFTEEPLLYDTNDNLIGGELYITGDSSNISVLINPDGSVKVLYNGSLYQNYAGVDQLPQYEEYCQ